MSTQLLRPGTVGPPLASREARRIYARVKEAGLKVDGSLALAAHAMESLLMLDARRVILAQGDPTTNVLLSEIQATAVQQVKKVQASLFDSWEM
jgi:hypothetical protein